MGLYDGKGETQFGPRPLHSMGLQIGLVSWRGPGLSQRQLLVLDGQPEKGWTQNSLRLDNGHMK